jgi:hypothetical protein
LHPRTNDPVGVGVQDFGSLFELRGDCGGVASRRSEDFASAQVLAAQQPCVDVVSQPGMRGVLGSRAGAIDDDNAVWRDAAGGPGALEVGRLLGRILWCRGLRDGVAGLDWCEWQNEPDREQRREQGSMSSI